MAETAFSCPVCGESLAADPNAYRCRSGHSYDRARQGYVNLLPRNRKRSSGDSPAMLQARRRVLESGAYRPLAAGLAALIERRPLTVLDIGCGEGYYLRTLAGSLHSGGHFYGLDISKTGAAMASSAHRAGHYAVANSFRPPLRTGSVDVVVKVFAPAPAAELARILKPNGTVLELIPAPDHLVELRRAIYAEDRPHDDAFSAATPQLPVREVVRINEQVTVPEGLDLLAMTPYWHHADDQARAGLRGPVTVTLDCELRLLRR